jgi:hypothetical protein
MIARSAARSVMTWLRIATDLAGRPALWTTSIRQARAIAAPRWWTHRPWLPVPDAAYQRFRATTQYGDADHPPERGDVVAYLSWCRSWERALR